MIRVPVVQKRFSFRLSVPEVAVTGRDLAFILGPLVGRTRAQGAVVYQVDEDLEEFRAIAVRAEGNPRIQELSVPVGGEAVGTLRRSVEPFHATTEIDGQFAGLPEVLQYGFTRILLFPLRSRDSLLGVLTLGRTNEEPFDAKTVRYATPVARVVGAVLERDMLRLELQNRKLMERAKGIIQQRQGVSEEEAYLWLRKQSRRFRRSMSDLAKEIIGDAVLRKTA